MVTMTLLNTYCVCSIRRCIGWTIAIFLYAGILLSVLCNAARTVKPNSGQFMQELLKSASAQQIFLPLSTANITANRHLYGKLLRSNFLDARYIVDANDPSLLLVQLSSRITAFCHVQFHSYTMKSGERVDKTEDQFDFPMPSGFIHIYNGKERKKRSILDVIRSVPQLSRLHQAIQTVPGLPEYLACNGPVTMFAANNDGWERFGLERMSLLMRWPNAMQELLTNMVVTNGTLVTDDWADGDIMTTLNSYGSLQARIAADGVLRIINSRPSPFMASLSPSRAPSLLTDRARPDQALVLETDYYADNGVLHIVDNVLYPPVPAINETVAQLFPFSPYMPLPPIQVDWDSDCVGQVADSMLATTTTTTSKPLIFFPKAPRNRHNPLFPG
ncbi:uncharacterized protein LOC129595202 [Paramacrobiotus metropolitanus]|uniref:uncharacterized protein LOC129595202 n=1 Tax=Paramacrobiotus metropolitanus TaxID=2943436 RepID=UPI0024461097|nr:uncharacterized protein LOC129595202 [Paramacrobiotus metropolitanus]